MAEKEITLKIPKKVKILGISFSPRKNANTTEQVKFALKAAESMGYVETEFLSIANYHLSDCIDCKKCIGYNKPADDPPMCYNDPLDQGGVIREKEAGADGLLWAFPVYTGGQPAKLRMLLEKPCWEGDRTPFFNVTKTQKAASRYKPQAVISQAGQHYGGQEHNRVASRFGGGLNICSWPTVEDPEPQASFMGAMITSVDGMSVYAKDAWTSSASRVSPPLTGIRNERTLRNLGRWLAVATMMMRIGELAFTEAGISAPEPQYFVRYSGGKPKEGSVIERLIKEGKVTYVSPEELEARKKVKA